MRRGFSLYTSQLLVRCVKTYLNKSNNSQVHESKIHYIQTEQIKNRIQKIMSKTENKEPSFIPVPIALLTISDSRTLANDDAGDLLAQRIESAGHQLAGRSICKDNIYKIRALISQWLIEDNIQAIITTGGTGITGYDGTPEAILPLLDKVIDGFGEMFRSLSYQNIKTSTLQSRAFAGVANGTFIFCLPGSPGACKDGWDLLISHQLDHRTKPCNLVELMPRLQE